MPNAWHSKNRKESTSLRGMAAMATGLAVIVVILLPMH